MALLPTYMGIVISQYKDPIMNQSRLNGMSCHWFVPAAHLARQLRMCQEIFWWRRPP